VARYLRSGLPCQQSRYHKSICNPTLGLVLSIVLIVATFGHNSCLGVRRKRIDLVKGLRKLNFEQETARFIGGVGRSGTNLIVDMLGLHPSLSPIYETDFALYFLEFVRNRRLPQLHEAIEFSLDWATPLPYRPHSKRKHEKYHHGPHYILFTLKHMRERIDAFLGNLRTSDLVLETGEPSSTMKRRRCSGIWLGSCCLT
jgi:hypothetical protein